MSHDENPALRFAAAYRVRFDEAGPDGHLRTSNLLRYAQDVGWRHSEARGLTREWYADRDLAWVVRGAELELLAPIPMGATVEVTTRVVGYQRIWAQRRAACHLPDGSLAAAVRTDWVMIDGRGRLVRVPAEIAEQFPAPTLSGSLLRVPQQPTPDDAARRLFGVRPHELDPMNHPNNAVYVDWLEEMLLAAANGGTVLGSWPRTLRLEYAAAPGPAARIEGSAWPSGGGWAIRLADEAGSDLFRASVQA